MPGLARIADLQSGQACALILHRDQQADLLPQMISTTSSPLIFQGVRTMSNVRLCVPFGPGVTRSTSARDRWLGSTTNGRSRLASA